MPSSWEELTEAQLLYIMHCLGRGVPPDRVQVYAFLRFAGLAVMEGKAAENAADADVLFLRRGHLVFPLSRKDLCLGAMEMDFIRSAPEVPMRPSSWKGVAAVDCALHGVPFGEYLQMENFFQRYLAEPQAELLFELAQLLYPGIGRDAMTGVLKYVIVHWLTGLKMYFARLFPDLFRPAAQDGDNGSDGLREIMLAQIRALTAGDVTKEHAVLNVDTWTALAELNAKAREARELERIYKNKY